MREAIAASEGSTAAATASAVAPPPPQHFAVLDGLRGVAAIAVVALHAQALRPVSGFDAPLYLAVDFFFLLSGFVVSYAYDHRLDRDMSGIEFCRRRFARLYPMLFAGILLGSIAFLSRQAQTHSGRLGEGLLMSTTAFLMIPSGLFLRTTLFSVNPPVWSLFFEFVANAVYSTPVRRVRGGLAVFVLLVSLAALFVFARASGSVELGPERGLSFMGGFARIAFSFSLGVAIRRTAIYRRFPVVPAWLIAVALALVLCLRIGPVLGDDLGCVLLVFPVILCLGAMSSIHGVSLKVCRWLGMVSYPVYLLHQPLLRGLSVALGGWPALPFGLVGGAVSLIAAWIVHDRFEAPAVAWLNGALRRLGSRRAAEA